MDTFTLPPIAPIDRALEPAINAHLDDLTKPPGSLGRLEDIARRYCMIVRSATPTLGRKVIFTFAADHGVVDEGVSAWPKEVTQLMVMNMLAGGAAINVLSRHCGADVRLVDIGVDHDFGDQPGLLDRKVRRGTGNIRRGPAMSLSEAEEAVQVGIDLACEAVADGATLLGAGEMGIGNTTPSSALMAALLPCNVADITGRGAGLEDAQLDYKIRVIRDALAINESCLVTPMSTLAAVGGLEIAGMCGVILGAAASAVPVVVDGFISSAAALVACRLCPTVNDYLFFSHLSAEAGHTPFMTAMQARPLLQFDMRLGEGTGAALAMTVIDAALKIYTEMATFSNAGISSEAR